MTGPADRERDAVDVLDRWPDALRGVLIGGYAVSAYGPPRYSADLDLVVPGDTQGPLEAWLEQDGFGLEKRWKSRAAHSPAVVSRWRRGLVALDLLAGAVRDREAAVDIPVSWVSARPRMMRLVLQSASTATAVPVCRPQALWALKLAAGRPQDLSDLFAISEVAAGLDEVRALFERLWCPTLERRLARVALALGDERVYKDACSRRSLGPPDAARNRRAWAAFRRRVLSVTPPTAR